MDFFGIELIPCVSIEIRGNIVLIETQKFWNKIDVIETTFLTYEEMMDFSVSENQIDKLSSRIIHMSEDCFIENLIVGNCLIQCVDHEIIKKSYWTSINFDKKSENIVKSDTEEEGNGDDSEVSKKKRKVTYDDCGTCGQAAPQ